MASYRHSSCDSFSRQRTVSESKWEQMTKRSAAKQRKTCIGLEEKRETHGTVLGIHCNVRSLLAVLYELLYIDAGQYNRLWVTDRYDINEFSKYS